MAKFLDTVGISYHLERIIKYANERLILISPYLKVNNRIKDLLKDKVRFNVDLTIIYGKKKLEPEEIKKHKSIGEIRYIFCKDLHAKCYLSEKEAIVASMNLHEFSESNNDEMGILISADNEPEVYRAIFSEAKRLIRIGNEIEVPAEKISKFMPSGAYCIRCKKPIELNPKKPYCRDCYDVWKKSKSKDFKERYCHICGKSNKSILEKPVCISCYKEYGSLFNKRNKF